MAAKVWFEGKVKLEDLMMIEPDMIKKPDPQMAWQTMKAILKSTVSSKNLKKK
jgi:hypothetical protein